MFKSTFNLAQTEVSTSGFQSWLVSNIVPIMLLAVGTLILVAGIGHNDRSGVMRKLWPLGAGLLVVGLAVSGSGPDVGRWMADLLTDK